jgi:DNA polymerase-3 subunit delta
MNFFVWAGEEIFLLHEKKQFWVSQFIKKHGSDMNIETLDADTVSEKEFSAKLHTSPLFGEKRLVFLESSEVRESFLERMNDIPETTVCVWILKNPDKRKKGYKEIIKKAKTEFFPLLDEKERKSFVQKYLEKNGKTFDPRVCQKLSEISLFLFPIIQEIEKLLLYTQDISHIEMSHLEDIVLLQEQSHIFQLLDAMYKKEYKTFQKLLRVLVKNGESLYQVIALLSSSLRNMFLSFEYASSEEMSKEEGIHPFSAKKAFQARRFFTQKEIERALEKFLVLDTDIKTGKLSVKTNEEWVIALYLEQLFFELFCL